MFYPLWEEFLRLKSSHKSQESVIVFSDASKFGFFFVYFHPIQYASETDSQRQWTNETAIQLSSNCVKRARDSIKRKYLIRILLKIVKQRRRRCAFRIFVWSCQKRNKNGPVTFQVWQLLLLLLLDFQTAYQISAAKRCEANLLSDTIKMQNSVANIATCHRFNENLWCSLLRWMWVFSWFFFRYIFHLHGYSVRIFNHRPLCEKCRRSNVITCECVKLNTHTIYWFWLCFQICIWIFIILLFRLHNLLGRISARCINSHCILYNYIKNGYFHSNIIS